MPSASSKPENKTSPEVETPIKQAIGAVERKVRNLEKRKGKLDGYKEKVDSGAVLNPDQKDALSKYEVVIQSLEFARELQKQFLSISADDEKLKKKQMRREKLEQQKTELKRFQELLELQAILDQMGSEDVREDFKTGKNGAAVLTEENLDDFDKLYKLINPSREEAGESGYSEELRRASEHIASYLDAKEKPVIGNTTYKMMKDLVVKINECGYFDKMPGSEEEEKVEETVEESTPQENAAPIQVAGDAHLKADYFTSSDKDTVPVSAQNTNQFEFLGAEEPETTQVMPQEYVPVNNVTHPAMVEDSFFNTGQYQQQQQAPPPHTQQQRPLNEIVDSVQGSFNFLQDSEIDLESPHMDPAVVAAHPMAPSAQGMSQTSDATMVTSYQSAGRLVEDQSNSQHASQDSKATTQQSLTSMSTSLDPSAGVFVSEQNVLDTTYTSQGYSNIVSQTLPSGAQHSYSTDPSLALQSTPSYSAMGGVTSISTDSANVPPAIPMPNQAATLDNQQMSEAESQEKKFTMNADAAVFKSMYSQPTFPDQQQDNDRGFEQDSDYQGSDMNQSNYYRGRGGSRGGRGNRGNMGNGYRGRGGNYGGGNRGGNWNSRGGGNRGPRGSTRGGNQRGRGGFGGRPGSGQQQ